MPNVPRRYVPTHLTSKDKDKVRSELRKSRRLYKRGKYYRRKKVKSFKSRGTRWKDALRKTYKISKNTPLKIKLLAQKSKCSPKALRKIIAKGKGAYYSSGSRPNQTASSWGKARLYSTLSGGPASRIDLHILKQGCKKNSKALKMAYKVKKTRVRNKTTL